MSLKHDFRWAIGRTMAGAVEIVDEGLRMCRAMLPNGPDETFGDDPSVEAIGDIVYKMQLLNVELKEAVGKFQYQRDETE